MKVHGNQIFYCDPNRVKQMLTFKDVYLEILAYVEN